MKLEVWKTMVGAKLRYGSEVWFVMQKEETALEVEQLGWLRCVLRVNKGTTGAFMRGEGGMAEACTKLGEADVQ